MDFSAFSSPEKRPQGDACIVVCVQEDKKVIPLCEEHHLVKMCHHVMETEDFSAKDGEISIVYPDPVVERRFFLVGVGEKKEISVEKLRIAFGAVASKMQKMKVAKASILTPSFDVLSVQQVLRGILEGLCFGVYDARIYRTKLPADEGKGLKDVAIMCHSLQLLKDEERIVKARMSSIELARDLVNKNADEVTPEGFAHVASSLEKGNLKVEVHGKEWIERQKMGLFLAVARGSRHEPRLVIMEWKGAPHSKDRTALVGKGITFDSGGLNLKSSENMKEMKSDMAGAAAVLGTMKAIRDLHLPINVVAVIPLCENSIGANAYKPGDVYVARSGKTVEIANTDAEGRLILADALSYVKDVIQPSRVIDVATLTGAAEVALGSDFSAVFSNTDSLFFLLEKAAIHSGELLWRMPLHREYLKLLESDIADCKNVASRVGGAINAAVFLEQFVGDLPWAHFDIAGTAFLKESRHYLTKGATGAPVRTLVEFLQELSSPS